MLHRHWGHHGSTLEWQERPGEGRTLPSENAPAAEGMRELSLLRDQLFDRRIRGLALDISRLLVEPLQRGQLFLTTKLRALDSRF
jgi:hypothetical protein